MNSRLTLLVYSGFLIGCHGDDACVDRIPDCAEYTSQACDPPYVTWAKQNCPAFCGICNPPCTDKRRDCAEYGRQACLPPYGRWASTYCAAYCGYCGKVFLQDIQAELDYIGENLDVNVTILDNLKYNGWKHKISLVLTNTGRNTIRNGNWSIYFYSFYMLEPDFLPTADGYILPHYFLKLNHIKGCLFSITPVAGFPDLGFNQSHYSEFYAQYWDVSRTDVMPNWYVAASSLRAVNIRSTVTGRKFVTDFRSVRQWKRSRVDQENPFTAQQRYRRYHIQDVGKAIKLITPTPKLVGILTDDFIPIKNMSIFYDPQLRETADFLAERLNLSTVMGDSFTQNGTDLIWLRIGSIIGLNNSEAYRLHANLTSKTIDIMGQSAAGVFYGVQSLLSLVSGSPNKRSVPHVLIEDEPRYEFRGMHIDVARNFRPKSDILRLLDAMAMYKMNRLHLHLSDDEGWRLEIPGIPELTYVGGKRCHDLTENQCLVPQLGSGADRSGSGFYSVLDYKEIVEEARKRYIEVIPEIDMPGHSRAAIIAMEARYLKYGIWNQSGSAATMFRLIDSYDHSKYFSIQMFKDDALNPCIESTYTFIEKVVLEIRKMHKGLRTFHFGGDEVAPGPVWANSTRCQELAASLNFDASDTERIRKYFAHRVANITSGLGLAGWEDGFMDENGVPYDRQALPNTEVYANAWQNIWEWGNCKRAYDLANNGYKVIMSQSTHLFLDMPPEPDPEEPGLYWATRFTDALKTFRFLPDRLYENIETTRIGEKITRAQVCGKNDENCPALIQKSNIIGLQGQLWGETMLTSDRFHYMLFPRLLSVAERAWHKASWEDLDKPEREIASFSDWEEFSNTIAYKELDRLQDLGIKYRVPLPGAIMADDGLRVTTEFPGHTVQVSSDRGASWRDVPVGLNLTHDVLLRTRARDGKSFSREITFHVEEPLAVSDQHLVDYIAETLLIRYNVVSNIKIPQIFEANISLTNNGNRNLSSGNWEIYLFSSHLIQPKEFPYAEGYILSDCDMRLFHVAGSLFKMSPERQMKLSPNESMTCSFVAQGYQVARSDSMPNWYVVADGMQAKDIKSTQNESLEFVEPMDKPDQYLRFSGDVFTPFSPEKRFQINHDRFVHRIEPKVVIPTPVYVTRHNRSVVVDDTWVMYHSSVFPKEEKLIADLFNISIENIKPKTKYIDLKVGPPFHILDVNETRNEAYVIDISTSHIEISALTSEGAFYAYKTLQSLKETLDGKVQLPVMTVRDQPRFQYRGLHLDVSRAFHSKAEILLLLEAMSMYKLNRFHFHLSDDEGWRLQIPELPELTEVGAWRCHDPYRDDCLVPQLGSGGSKIGFGSGFYTVSDYKEILQYARDRHIQVIPDIAMPVHTRAAKKAMEARYRKYIKYGNSTAAQQFLLTDFADKTRYLTMQMYTDNAINICMNSTYNFIRLVVRAIKDMHHNIQPLEMMQIGGDGMAAVWENSTECKKIMTAKGMRDYNDLREYFVNQMSQILRDEGLNMAVFEEVIQDVNSFVNTTEMSLKGNLTVLNWNDIWEWGNGEGAYKLANSGYKVVIGHATHLYLDHTHEPDPFERGASWASRFIDTRKVFGFVPSDIYHNADRDFNNKHLSRDQICHPNGLCTDLKRPENIIGLQAQVWTEIMRTESELHEMVFPRIIAVAERAWHKALWEKTENRQERIHKTDQEWASFAAALERELKRLDDIGIKYRIPLPGARIVNGAVEVNTAIPGLSVEYSIDDQNTWSDVTPNLIIVGDHVAHFRTRSPDGSRFSRNVRIQVG